MGFYCTSVCESKDPSVAGRVAHTERASHLTSEHSVLRFVRSVRSVRIVTVRMLRAVDGSYAPYKPSELLTVRILSTCRACISLWHQGTVFWRFVRGTIRTNRNGPYAWLIRTVLIPRYITYISHKAKQARSHSNIPRSISHKPQEARFKYNISRSISNILKQARFKCNIPRSISLNHNKRALNVTFLVL